MSRGRSIAALAYSPLIVAICMLAGAGCGGTSEQTTDAPGTTTSGTDTDTDTTGFGGEPFDQACELAPSIFAGLTPSSFHEVLAGPVELCGQSQVVLFTELQIDKRSDVEVLPSAAGFAPTLAVVPPSCELNQAMCLDFSDGEPTILRDYLPGTRLIFAAGVDAAHPDLATPAPEEGPGSLDFEVLVRLYPVRELGERCGSKELGRCAPGGVCQPTDPENFEGLWTCSPVEADTCNHPEVVEIGAEPLVLEIDALLQSDAHHHSCMGDGHPERVVAIQLPEIGPEQKLVARSSDPVGLAFRAPGCLLGDEQACGEPSDEPVEVSLEGAMTPQGWQGLEALAAAGVTPLLFIELPIPAAPDAEETGDTGEPFSQLVTVELQLETI